MHDATSIEYVAEQIAISSGLPGSARYVLRHAHDCVYPPAILETDILHVDFGVRAVDTPGLYLVETMMPDLVRVEWRGCRRFDVGPTGLYMDQRGKGDWVPVDFTAWRMRIAGRVIDVYRPTRDDHDRRRLE